MSLTACSSQPKYIIRTEYASPPTSLLQPTEIPRFTGSNRGDVIADYVPDLIGAIRACNIDKESISNLKVKE